MKYPLLFISFFIMSAVCGRGYQVSGTVTGFPEGTLLFLDYTNSSGRHLDSTYTRSGGVFHFEGVLENEAIYSCVRTKDYKNYFFFWLENTVIHVTAEKGKFRQALITGSRTQVEQEALNAMEATAANKKDCRISFIRSHPASVISAHILNSSSAQWGRDTIASLYNLFPTEIKDTYYGRAIAQFLALNKNVSIGQPLADFSQPDAVGNPVFLSQFKGKVILLEFWGSWCVPCRKANPALVRIYNEYKDKGFEILGVAAETNKKQWLQAIQADGLPWTNVTELKGDKNSAALIYGVTAYPSSFLIDKNGIIVARDLSGEALVEKLKQLL